MCDMSSYRITRVLHSVANYELREAFLCYFSQCNVVLDSPTASYT